ncbi:unnamed protein product, partial [Rotaria sp. Silwood1]
KRTFSFANARKATTHRSIGCNSIVDTIPNSVNRVGQISKSD